MLDKKNILNIYPLTPLQEGMLFREHMSGPGAYIMQSRFLITGELDCATFEQAWNHLVRRHDALRTLIAADGADRPLQVVLRKMSVDIVVDDCSHMDDGDRDEFIGQTADRERTNGFVLKNPPLFRIRLFGISPHRHVFLFTFHHIIMDGWCQGILHEELLACYTALSQGRRPSLPAAVPFSRYLHYLDGRDKDKGLAFWHDKLADFEPSSAIGWATENNTTITRYTMDVLEFTLPETSVARLRNSAAECSTTLNAAVQALWGTTISLLSGKRDVAWGTVVSGRPPELPGSDRTIGLFINTIPMRIRLDKRDSFRDTFMETGKWLAGSMAHQHVPLADIRQASDIAAPLFDHLVIFENYPVADTRETAKTTLSIVPDGRLSGHTDYDIVFVADSGDDLTCFLKYNASVISEKTITLIRDAFLILAGHALDTIDRSFADITPLPETVLRDMVQRFAPGDTLPVDNRTFPELFDDCANRHPDRTAIVAADGSLSYRELQCASDAVAEALVRDGNITPGSPVALMTGRNRSMLAGIIAIMKAGAVFVPLDPSYPDERVSFILEHSGCRAVLAGEKHHHRFEQHTIPIVTIETAMTTDESTHPSHTKARLNANDAAYIIYTSGSTGTPKGVVVEHRSLTNFIHGYGATIPDYQGSALTIAFVANYVFDAAGRAFYPSLCYGHTVAVADEETRLDSTLLARFLSQNEVDILDCTPTLASIALEAECSVPTLKRVVLGGEALKRTTIDTIRTRYPDIAITNVYGPTETTIDSSFCHIDAIRDRDREIAPIGRALPNQTLYVLDETLSPLPVGAEGEICIGGTGVARGYLNRVDLTEKSFVADPFNPGGRLYRTGDTGYWREDGILCFKGRRDGQVKIRGFRIEPGEIESAVAAVTGVRQCAVIVADGPLDDKRLHVFFTGSPELTAQSLRMNLSRRLPAHMMPGVITSITQMPMTATGKIDRVSLKSQAAKETRAEERHSPDEHVTSSERAVLNAMKSLLDRGNVHTNDNFFELGGHSLLAVRLVSLLTRSVKKRLPVSAVYRHPTAKKLATFIDRYDPELNEHLTDFHISFNENDTPLYCFPPYGGSGTTYLRFAESFKDHRRLVCFNYLKDVDFVSEAAAYIMSEAHNTPVTLLGFSGGGNLAFETALAIEHNGGSVDHIIMLDSYCRLESVKVPRELHERDMRAILESDEYAVFFTDTAARETAVINGTAYAEYLYRGVENGTTHARITMITAENSQSVPDHDHFGMRRSLNAWKNHTTSAFETLEGKGGHDLMLEESFCGANASIVRSVLDY